MLEIIKKTFIEGFVGKEFNIYTAAFAMLITCFFAVYIFMWYNFFINLLSRKTEWSYYAFSC